MKWTGLNELREEYLKFFESKEHLRLKSFPLVPKDDKSLLLINSGMAPMKKYFTGEVTPPSKRVTTCQKCIRTPDIERVGITSRHGTYFEMLGNFSFGDYFKTEATAWAWEFFTQVLDIPVEKLFVSIYENDDEAYDIWTKNVGVEPSHMVRLGKEDNFWEHGVGPCGPCSEIYYDRGEKHSCGKEDCFVGCDCDRYVEVWNLVFTQFESDGKGNYTPLEHPNIDTGMGLERLACIMQDVDNLFLVDTVQNIMKHISEITNIKYGDNESNDVSLRVITDHIRSTTFMIGDGVMPSNEGRGYVLRRLLRRAARHGRLLGMNETFLYKVCSTVIKENESAYPELKEKEAFITKLIKTEEESFAKTIEQGFQMLSNIIKKGQQKMFSGEDAFKLNDTYGFPLDLTKEILSEKGIIVDEKRFFELLDEQKNRARNARKNAGADAWVNETTDLSHISPTEFLGYTDETTASKILGIIKDGQLADALYQGEKAVILLDKTPFYAEGGGQAGDAGTISTKDFEFKVSDTVKDPSGIFMHSGFAKAGVVKNGDHVKAAFDVEKRRSTMRNHTAAHLLQAALREVLGNHVEQAGQMVDSERMRFDFTHFSAMTQEEITRVEQIVNKEILNAVDVDIREMPIEEAKKLGAMALFGEKYGDVVRVVKINDFSIELCGGTHQNNTSKLGLFKILYEGSVAAGVRRIEAVTGTAIIETINSYFDIINRAAESLKINNPKELVKGSMHLFDQLKTQEREIEHLREQLASIKMKNVFDVGEEINGVKLMSAVLNDVSADMLKKMCERASAEDDDCVVVLAGISENKATIACACGKNARQKGAHAGKIVKAVAQIADGNGGGRPDIAMAGAKDISKLDDAIVESKNIVKDIIK